MKMNKFPAATTHWGDDVPELPEVARTRSGVEFDPRADRWVYREAVNTISLNFVEWPATDLFMRSVKLTLLWYAVHMSPTYLRNMHALLRHYMRTMHADKKGLIAEITSIDLINYRSTLDNNTSWYLGSLSGFLRKWHSLGYPGVTADAVALLKQLRIKGNKKGEAVLTHDPLHGPFTDIEIESLSAALDKVYMEGNVERELYVLAYLCMMLGQRAVQYAALKVRDVSVAHATDGTPIFTLKVPCAKQRNHLTRAAAPKDRVLIPQIGEILVQHASAVRVAFQGRLADPSDAPLFPARRQLGGRPKGFEYHRTAMSLEEFLENGLEKLSVMSERTGLPLNITAVRFRRTVGTRAAMEGYPELAIAELLGHTDTQNVGVYIEARPEIVERIDRTLAMHMAPMAQAFAGVIIEDESQAIRAGDPSSRICDPRFEASMKPMGNCGKHGFCGFLAPIACYTCGNFQPWLDGPHETVLDYLLTERERLASTADLRIAAINDRTIFAVAEVVRLCQARREESVDG